MMTSRQFNINRLRSPYESDAEWKLREEFLKAHRDSYPVHRLLCLSNCYINSRVYGCRYPSGTMEELARLSAGLSKFENIQKVQFVKSSDDKKTKANETTGKVAKKVTDSKPQGNKVLGHKGSIDEVPDSKVSIKKSQDSSTSNKVLDSKQLANKAQAGKVLLNKTSDSKNPVNKVPESKPSEGTGSVSVGKSKTASSIKSSFAAQCEPQPVVHPPPKTKQKSSEKVVPNASSVNKTFSDSLSPIDQKFFTLSQMYRDFAKKDANYRACDILPIVGMKCKTMFSYKYKELPAPKGLHKFVCTIFCESTEMADGEGGNKKKSKQDAIQEAGNKLSKDFLKVVKLNPETEVLQASDEYFPTAWSLFEHNEPGDSETVHKESNAANLTSVSKKRKFSEAHGDLSRFLLIEPKESSGRSNAKSILQASADFNKAPLEYEFHDDSTGVRCRVILDGHILVEYFGTGRVNGKNVAAEKALEYLQKICWSVKIKQSVDTEEAALSRDEVIGEIQEQVKTIPEDNIGHQLLKKMGWTGGGIGAEGNKGKEEPVAESLKLQQVIHREGFGASKSDEKEFKSKMFETLESYTKSDKQEDLVFSSEFTKEERAFIHQQAQRFGLKTNSRGSGDDRYLTVSRRRSAFQLFNHLIDEGGSTAKYELVPPGQSSQT